MELKDFVIARTLGKLAGLVVGVVGVVRTARDNARRELEEEIDRENTEHVELIAKAVGVPKVSFDGQKVKVET